MRARGKVSLLTYDMETELLHWVAVSQKHSDGVDMHSRVAFALSDPEHHKRVKELQCNLFLFRYFAETMLELTFSVPLLRQMRNIGTSISALFRIDGSIDSRRASPPILRNILLRATRLEGHKLHEQRSTAFTLF
jgi:hypothetical protein